MTNQINSPLYVQEYSASREGYRCGRCGAIHLRYAGEPHIDSVGVVCEPPNKLVDTSPVQASGAGPAEGALPEIGQKTADVEPKAEEPKAEETEPQQAEEVKLDKPIAAEERKPPKSWSAVKPLKLNSTGDVDA